MAIMVQPIQMIGYIVKNDAPSKEALAMPRYSSERRFSFRQKERSKEYLESEAASRPEGGIYCGTKWSQDLSVNVPGNIKMAFTANTLYLMDKTQIYDDVSSDFFLKLGQKWAQRRNLVFLSDDKAIHQDARSLSGKKTAESVDENSTSVKVVYFTPNTLELRTALDRPRFLLWVDNYHSGWHVFINGREERLFRADHTFKGVWLPSGKSDILFRFEKPLTYLWRYFVWFSFLLALGVVVFLAIRERSCMDEQKAVS